MRSIQSLTIQSYPASEPVSLSDMKLFLKRDDTDDDSYISALITCARQRAESYVNRCLVTTTFDMRLDGFPNNQALLSNRAFFGQLAPDGSLYIPRPPLQSVSYIQYLDTNNVQQTLDPSQYVVDIYREPARVALAPGVTAWPDTYETVNAVTVRFIAGYDGVTRICPQTILQAIRMMVGAFYEERTPVQHALSRDLPKIVRAEGLLWNDKVVEFR